MLHKCIFLGRCGFFCVMALMINTCRFNYRNQNVKLNSVQINTTVRYVVFKLT